MNNTITGTAPIAFDQTVVASYGNHSSAEAAVRRLSDGGLPINQISIVGRNFETHEDIQGFYRPADAALDGASQGAWFGGIFGLMMGALGFFVFPVLGSVMIIGPLAGFVAGAIGGAGVGALINALIMMGIPRNQAFKYQERLEAGEFLVTLHGSVGQTAQAHEILEGTSQTHLQTYHQAHDATTKVPSVSGAKI